MDKFTVEEINLMCVFEGQDRTGMIADIQNVIPHIQDSDMVELNLGVTVKLPPRSGKKAQTAPIKLFRALGSNHIIKRAVPPWQQVPPSLMLLAFSGRY